MKLKNLKELLQMYKKYTVTGVAVFAAAAMLTTGCTTTKTGDTAEGTTGATNETTDEDANELVENTHASVERLVTKYLDCIISGDTDTLATITDELTDEDKAKIVSRATAYDSYENMVCYTKDGPEEDSYIVFLCFDIRLKDFLKVETLVPDIQCLYVTPKDEDGSRYIRYSNVEDDEELQAYVKQLEEDPEVKALYADMQSRYQEALETDEALRTFMEKVTTGSGSDDAEASDEQTEEAAAEETTEEQPEEAQESVETGEAQVQNRETRVKESVNVRSDATTDSDRIALAYQGDAITEIESYDNGWSKVEYNGQTGYVKTEFLE